MFPSTLRRPKSSQEGGYLVSLSRRKIQVSGLSSGEARKLAEEVKLANFEKVVCAALEGKCRVSSWNQLPSMRKGAGYYFSDLTPGSCNTYI